MAASGWRIQSSPFHEAFFSWLYFGSQRFRAGVTVEDIARARRLLDATSDALHDHLRVRLEVTHGASAPVRQWLEQQPVMSKEDYRKRARNWTGNQRHVDWRRTAGSSGEPLRFPKDPMMTAQMDAAMWACYSWYGIRPGMRHIRFWGGKREAVARFRQRLTDRALARRRLSAFEISPEQSVAYFHRARRFGPKYAYGYPTLMSHFVEHCRDAGLSGRELGIGVVISTGEVLNPQVRTRMAEFFEVPVINEYGCSESGILAFECEEGSMHKIPLAVFTEVLGDAPGIDATSPDGRGEIVITDLAGSVVPLLRYRLGDSATESPDGCTCGRGLPTMRVDVGRVDSFIRTPDGGLVYDAILAYTVPQEVQRFLVRQESVDRLHAYVVPGRGFTGNVAKDCQETWQSAIGGGISVEVEVVDEIPYAQSGKLRYFVPLGEN